MSGETATAVLRDGHALILRVTAALEHTLDRLETGTEPDLDLVADCVVFFRLFADACHHGKEEDLLFTGLERFGMRSDEGPIAVMLEEHRRGREMVARMAAALPRVPESREALHALRTAAWSWIDLIRSHIAKEDGVLFEIADGLVRGPRCRQLCDDYRDADTCTFESRTKPELEALAERITARIEEA